jgi:hypothetical protein
MRRGATGCKKPERQGLARSAQRAKRFKSDQGAEAVPEEDGLSIHQRSEDRRKRCCQIQELLGRRLLEAALTAR